MLSEQFIQAFSDIFKDIQQYSAMFRPISRHYCSILSYVQTYSDICVIHKYNHYKYNHYIFRTLAYSNLEPETSSNTCQTCQMIKHIQSPPGIVRTVFSSIFKNILGYSGILMHIPSHSGNSLFYKTLHLKFWTVF